jgi:putative membrane protein
MKKLHLLLVISLGLAAPYPVLGQTSQASQPANPTDAAFLRDAAQSGMAEVQASQLAVTKAAGQDVKDFARKMVQDHTQANAKVQQLAQAKGTPLPSELSAADAKNIKALGALSGAQFDRYYMDEYGQKAHRSSVEKFRKQSQTGQDGDIKSFATQTLPTLEQHLEHAAGVAPSGASR